jgi:hypothetical protein
MKRALKDFGWVVLAAIVASLPAAIFTSPRVSAPVWYSVPAALAGALGMGLIAIAFGSVALIARRNHPNGSLKPALIVTSIVGVFTSFAVISAALKIQ